MTLSVPEDLKEKMDEFPEINWSEIARASIKRRLLMLLEIQKFTKDSDFTEEDASRLGRELNKRLVKRRK